MPIVIIDGTPAAYTDAAAQVFVVQAVPQILYVPVATVRERMEAAGTWAALAEILVTDPAALVKVLTLRDGIAPDDAQARAMIAATGSDPDVILAP